MTKNFILSMARLRICGGVGDSDLTWGCWGWGLKPRVPGRCGPMMEKVFVSCEDFGDPKKQMSSCRS